MKRIVSLAVASSFSLPFKVLAGSAAFHIDFLAVYRARVAVDYGKKAASVA